MCPLLFSDVHAIDLYLHISNSMWSRANGIFPLLKAIHTNSIAMQWHHHVHAHDLIAWKN